MNATERGLITTPDVSSDPVIARKRRKLELIEQAARVFKRIDIQFLAIVKNGDMYPAFAVLPLELYQKGGTCTFTGVAGGYSFSDGTSYQFVDLFRKKVGLSSSGTATPQDQIPDEALAVAEEQAGVFDQMLVAWEADWQESYKGDPLLIGEIDGVWFLLAKWDTTKLESYVSG